MPSETLLVIGIHREELGFGDRVAALVDRDSIDVLRIPSGIPQARTGTDDHFYSNTQHREIYLQLRQQVKGRYRLLIDLHNGIDESGCCADVFCHDEAFLERLSAQIGQFGDERRVRLVKIIAQDDTAARGEERGIAEVGARTWIPRKIWDDGRPLYVGLETYLPSDGEGEQADWRFALRMIDRIRSSLEANQVPWYE